MSATIITSGTRELTKHEALDEVGKLLDRLRLMILPTFTLEVNCWIESEEGCSIRIDNTGDRQVHLHDGLKLG